MRRLNLVGFLFIASLGVAAAASAGTVQRLPADVAQRIDDSVAEVLKKTQTPSASIAIVRDGQIAYVKAYGLAQLKPARQAAPQMRYGIASNSKAFTAAAILMLVDEGKLKLDDPVSNWFPGLTSADKVTVRQLLSHTSGYSDYWPQDYAMASIQGPVTPDAIINTWAKKPLDYAPGTAWQYSNTGYVIAARIAETVAGQSLFSLLKQRIFAPLHMDSVVDNDQKPILPPDAVPYTRFDLGPNRPAPRLGPGWLYGAGELAMTAEDLARWDQSLIARSLLSPAAYDALTTPVKLSNGDSTGYGLGLFIGEDRGHRFYSHRGEDSGFVSAQRVYPDDRAAIVVETNTDASGAARDIAVRIAFEILPSKGFDGQARAFVEALAKGQIDRAPLTANMSAYYTPAVLKDARTALSARGPLRALIPTDTYKRGGMTYREYRAVYTKGFADVSFYITRDGKIEQFLIETFGD